MKIIPIASGSSGNCYILQSDAGDQLLIEAGVPLAKVRKACGGSFQRVQAACLTHEHGDHGAYALALEKSGIPVYCSRGTANALCIFGTYYTAEMKSNEIRDISPFFVTGFGVHHDAAEPFGFQIDVPAEKERVIFLTDTVYTEYKFKNVTRLMIEANFDDGSLDDAVSDGITDHALVNRIYRSHMSLETCIETIKANLNPFLKEIWLLHLSHNNADADAFKREVQRISGVPVYIA